MEGGRECAKGGEWVQTPTAQEAVTWGRGRNAGGREGGRKGGREGGSKLSPT